MEEEGRIANEFLGREAASAVRRSWYSWAVIEGVTEPKARSSVRRRLGWLQGERRAKVV